MLQKGDLLLKVNEASLDGLTHSQAVATLKATISLSSVSLTIMEVRTLATNIREDYQGVLLVESA